MRILVAAPHRSVVGGVESYLRELLPCLAARGHALALMCEDKLSGRANITEGVANAPVWHLSDAAGLRDAEAWSPDVCFLQGLEDPCMESRLIDRFPTVLFAHNYHGTCISGSKHYAAPFARPCHRKFGMGCLVAYLPCRCGGLNPITMLALYARERRRLGLLSRYQAVAVASRHMFEEYRRHGVGTDRLHLLPLFPTGQRPDQTTPPGRPTTGRVLFVGRLTDLKGPLLLVDSVCRARAILQRPLTLVVAGDGPQRQLVEASARNAGLEVEMAGWVTPERRVSLMRGADVLAIPGTWPEPFGLVGLEAGCVGLPAVAFAVGGLPDWLEAGVSGELAAADPPSSEKFAVALVRALRDPEHLHALGSAAWRQAQRFSPEAHVSALESILGGAARIPPATALYEPSNRNTRVH